MTRRHLLLPLPALLLSACTLAPTYERPPAPVPASWSQADATSATTAQKPAAQLAWQDLVNDARLRDVIALALDNNRDLRVASLNVDKVRAQYLIRDAALYPTINLGVGETAQHIAPGQSITGAGNGYTTRYSSASVGLSAYELDLFGRVRSLKDQALSTYLASQETARAARISLIAETVNAWLALAADSEQLTLAQDTLKSREDSQALIQRSAELGVASQLDLAQASTLTEGSRADVATLTSQVARDRNALVLLCGGNLPDALVPTALPAAISDLASLPAGMPSDVLLQRPDILAAEETLKSANANIGAARAAFFPTVTLTTSLGTASRDFNNLFGSGTRTWSFLPQLTVPIFDGGRNRANLRAAKVDREIAMAQYEKAIQVAFREVSDTLAEQATLDQRLSARNAVVAASEQAYQLAEARYRQGIDSYLGLQDAQRTLYSARQAQISTRQARLANLITLYKVLGGGSAAESAKPSPAT